MMSRIGPATLTLALLLTTIAEPLSAQTFEQTSGPVGGDFRTIATGDDGALYVAGSRARVHRSTDDGTTWTTHVVDESNAEAIVARIRAGNGALFLTVNERFPPLPATLYRSTDRGESWSKVLSTRSRPDTIDAISTLLFDGDSTVVIGARWRIYRSTDLGSTWDTLDGVARGVIRFGGVDRDGRFVLVTAPSGSQAMLLMRSMDGGSTWEQFGEPVTRFSAFGSGGEPLMIGSDGMFYISTSTSGVVRLDPQSGGSTSLTAGLPIGAAVLGTAESADGRLYAATFGGVFESTDRGASWSALGDDELATGALAVAVSSAGSIVVAGSEDLFWLSGDRQRWLRNERGIVASTSQALEASTNGWLYATHADELFRTRDGGTTWQFLETPFAAGATLWSVSTLGDTLLVAMQSPAAVYRSIDGGLSWTRSSDGFSATEMGRIVLVDGGRAIASTDSGVYRSSDAGLSWQRASNGLPPLARDEFLTRDLATRDAVTAYVIAQRSGIWRTTDGGDSWSSASDGLPAADPLVVEVTAGGIVLAGFVRGGLSRSTDGGGSWSPVEGIAPESTVEVIDAAAGRLVLATSGRVIHASTDDGASWRALDTLDAYVVSLETSPSGTAYAGTSATGVHRSQDAIVTGAPLEQTADGPALELSPQPATRSTTLAVTLTRPKSLALSIHDLTGRLVRSLAVIDAGAGRSSHRLDVAGLGPGLRVLRVSSVDGVASIPLVIIGE